MADNVIANAGSGGSTFATDDIAGVHYPRSKVVWGADGAANDTSAAAPLPVVQTGTPALPTGAATAANQTTANTSLATLAGAVAGTEMQVDIVASTTIAISDGSGSVTTDTPQLPTTIGQKTGAASLSIVLASDQANIGITDGGTSLTTDSPQLPATLGQKAMTASMAVVLASDQASIPVTGTFYQATQPISAATLPLPSGASTEATLAAQSAKLPATLGQKAMAASMAVVLASDQASVPVVATLAAGTATNEIVGDAAHDAAIAGNPVRVAGRGMSADYTAVATGDTADILASLLGKQVFLADALPANTWSYAAAAGGLVTTAGVTAKAAAGAGIRNYVSKAQIMNSHQTIGSEIVIRDGAAGTVLWRGWAQFTGGGAEVEFKPPLRGTANTLIEIAEVTATGTAGVLVNLQGFTAAE